MATLAAMNCVSAIMQSRLENEKNFVSRNETFRSKSSSNAFPVGSTTLPLPPSCIEFVPISPATSWAATESVFVVGTYDLQKEEQPGNKNEVEESLIVREQSRHGSLTLFKLEDDVLSELKSIPTPSAILDLHFFPNTTLFGVASSTGTISIYEIQRRAIEPEVTESLDEHVYTMTLLASHQVLDRDTIITYFSWDASSSRTQPRMAITSTVGSVTTLIFDENFRSFEFGDEKEVVSQHDYEAWCCAFSIDGKTLYSGGDDSKLIQSSLDASESSSRKLPFHNAGVTMILPIPLSHATMDESQLLLTGSYDDSIRVYQPPSPYNSKPKVLAQKDIGCQGGGVWRLKFLDEPTTPKLDKLEVLHGSEYKRRFLVLACCMRVGCKILEIKELQEGEWTMEVLAKTAVHESMNYASDILPVAIEGSTKSKVQTIVSTSFYDRLLFVWKWDPDVEAQGTFE